MLHRLSEVGVHLQDSASKQTKAEIYKKGAAYGIPGKRVDGNDLIG